MSRLVTGYYLEIEYKFAVFKVSGRVVCCIQIDAFFCLSNMLHIMRAMVCPLLMGSTTHQGGPQSIPITPTYVLPRILKKAKLFSANCRKNPKIP